VRTTMHILMLVTMLATSGSTRADVKVAGDASAWGRHFSSLEYGVNEQLGRAWLVLNYSDDGLCRSSDVPCLPDIPVRTTVPGLTYAPSTKQVLYREGSEEPLVCAQVVRHSFIASWETVEATGQCGSRVIDVVRFVDDGFDGTKEKHDEIWFGAANGSHSPSRPPEGRRQARH
jgi:hypothetical protein